MSGKSLHAIVYLFSEHINADGSVDPNSLHIAWMPLRGTIDVTRLCATPSSTTPATPPTVNEVPVRSPGPCRLAPPTHPASPGPTTPRVASSAPGIPRFSSVVSDVRPDSRALPAEHGQNGLLPA